MTLLVHKTPFTSAKNPKFGNLGVFAGKISAPRISARWPVVMFVRFNFVCLFVCFTLIVFFALLTDLDHLARSRSIWPDFLGAAVICKFLDFVFFQA